jgi:hypothetical protein
MYIEKRKYVYELAWRRGNQISMQGKPLFVCGKRKKEKFYEIKNKYKKSIQKMRKEAEKYENCETEKDYNMYI